MDELIKLGTAAMVAAIFAMVGLIVVWGLVVLAVTVFT